MRVYTAQVDLRVTLEFTGGINLENFGPTIDRITSDILRTLEGTGTSVEVTSCLARMES